LPTRLQPVGAVSGARAFRLLDTDLTLDVPVQFFQSVIAIELAVTGALLWQIRLGLAVSLIPIQLRVLPPLAKDAATNERDPDYAVTVLGLVVYTAVVAGFLVLLDVE
jgi:hypothetical protein